MIKRILSSQTQTITGAAIVLAAASFVSRVIGVVRDRIFAHTFGAGDVLDVYYAAFRIPDLVYNLVIVGALSAGFIPIFLKAYTKSRKQAWEMTNSLIHILGLALVVVSILLYIFTPQLMHLVVPGFDDAKLAQTVILTRIMFLSPLLLGLSAVVSGVLQSMKSFFVYSLTPIVYNIGIIFGTIVLVPVFGITGLAYGVILGALFHLLIQLPTLLSHGYTYAWKFDIGNKYVKEIGKLMGPRVLTLGTVQLNLLVITIIASTLGAGSVAVFNFANNLQHFPIGLIGISFAVAAFPTLSKLFAEKKKEAFIAHLTSTVKQILFFIIPLTLIFLLLRAQIVRLLLGSGQFDWTDTIITANALAFFSLSLFAQCLIPLLIRAFYAMHNTWIPLTIAFIGSLINIIGAILLKDSGLHVAGLALAFSIASIVQLALLWLALRYKTETLQESVIIEAFYKISFAGLAMGVTIQVLKTITSTFVDMERFWGVAVQGGFSAIGGLLVYLTLCYAFNLHEMNVFASSFKRRFLKLKSVEGQINEADEF